MTRLRAAQPDGSGDPARSVSPRIRAAAIAARRDGAGVLPGRPFPPEVRAAAVAARRAGAGVMEVARALGISHNAVSKWSREAGIEAPPHRPCGICVHPQRNEIDLALIEHSVETVRRQYGGKGLKLTMLDRHRRKHLGLPVGVQGGGRGDGASYCKVCSHPRVNEINRRLREGEQRAGLAREFAAFSRSILQHHFEHHLDNPQRDAAIAAAAELRRRAYHKIAERMGPPKGWLVCPECDSENVHSNGSGYWKEDPGPIFWHVTECLDCGWPDQAERSGEGSNLTPKAHTD